MERTAMPVFYHNGETFSFDLAPEAEVGLSVADR
jgi:hypothetical protein